MSLFRDDRTAVALVTLLLFLFLVLLDWRSAWVQEYGGRLAWLVFALLSLTVTIGLQRAAGVLRRIGWMIVAALAGFIPWIGLVALLSGLALVLFCAVLSFPVLCAGNGLKRRTADILLAAMPMLAACCMALAPAAAGGNVRIDPDADREMVLAELAAQDQADRRNGSFVINATRDRERRLVVMAQLHRGGELSMQARADAGLILLHGESTDELALAHQLLARAAKGGHARAASLEKAALDRLQLALGLPQIHGTQLIFRR